jgi:hypothetical protein
MLELFLVLAIQAVAAVDPGVAVRIYPARCRCTDRRWPNLPNTVLARRAAHRPSGQLWDEWLHAAGPVGRRAPGQRLFTDRLHAESCRGDAPGGCAGQAGKTGQTKTQNREYTQHQDQDRGQASGATVCSGWWTGARARQRLPVPAPHAVNGGIAVPVPAATNALTSGIAAELKFIAARSTACDAGLREIFWTIRALSGTIADYLKPDGQRAGSGT